MKNGKAGLSFFIILWKLSRGEDNWLKSFYLFLYLVAQNCVVVKL